MLTPWQKACIAPSASIKEAIQKIDEGSVQIALVVDEERHLLGTVTDGDIRRGILKGIPLSENVQKIMRVNPIVSKNCGDQKKVLQLMKQKHIHQLPIVDDSGKIIDLQIIDELFGASTEDHLVVLMAGGLGNRLRPLTDDIPKPLVPVGKKPILETIIETFVRNGFYKFCIAVHYKNQMIKEYFGDGSKWDAEISYITEKRQLGTAGALSLLPTRPSGPFFVMNSDLLTTVNFQQLLSFHRQNKSLATMCVREYDFQVPYGVVTINGFSIKKIDEKPVHKFFVNAGIYVLDPEVLSVLSKGKACDMPQLFDILSAQGKKTNAFPIREYWIDIGRLNDLEIANGAYSEIFNKETIPT